MNKLFIFFLLLISVSCNNSKKSNSTTDIRLSGAGATFPLPYYNLAFKVYQDSTGVSVTYGGIGSGGGIRSLKDRIVDFGGSDAFLTDAELQEMPDAIVQIPTCIGAVVLAYNLPGITNLKLTGEVIADIYLGNITRWNDKRLTAINPGINLPDQQISPIYRSDGSGTTFVFTDYLSKMSITWKNNVGTGKSLKWPAGIAAKGNPGIAGTISQTPGAIGYIGSEYAFALKLPIADLQNPAGRYVTPTTASISAAATSDIPADTRIMLTASPAEEAYPISCFTWLLIYREQNYGDRSLAQAEAVVKLMEWMLSPEAQDIPTKVHYSPLPATTVEQARHLLKIVTYKGENILQ